MRSNLHRPVVLTPDMAERAAHKRLVEIREAIAKEAPTNQAKALTIAWTQRQITYQRGQPRSNSSYWRAYQEATVRECLELLQAWGAPEPGDHLTSGLPLFSQGG